MAKRNLLPLLSLLLLFLEGCGTSHYYVLSTPSQPQRIYQGLKESVGVEKVAVPKYLFKREIAIATSSSERLFLPHALWAEDIEEGLTRRVIHFLQKKFHSPEIYSYPWGVEQQPLLIVKIELTRFIVQEKKVYLDASVYIENTDTSRHKATLFSTVVPVSEESASGMVEGMDSAFALLENRVAEMVRRFK